MIPSTLGRGIEIKSDPLGVAALNLVALDRERSKKLKPFIHSLGLKKVSLVGHDWGATLAWEYARRNPAKVRRIAFMKGVLPPMFPFPSFEAMGPEMEKMFRAFKDPVEGPRVVMDENMFHYIQEDHPDAIGREIAAWIRRN